MNLISEIEVAQRGCTPVETTYDIESNEFGEKLFKINSSRSSRGKNHLLIVSNQSTKVFPPDFFQNKKDSVINKKKQKYQSNSSSLKEKKHEDHHDLDDDSEILHLIKGKESSKENSTSPILLNKNKNIYDLKCTGFEMIPEEDEERTKTEYGSSKKFFPKDRLCLISNRVSLNSLKQSEKELKVICEEQNLNILENPFKKNRDVISPNEKKIIPIRTLSPSIINKNSSLLNNTSKNNYSNLVESKTLLAEESTNESYSPSVFSKYNTVKNLKQPNREKNTESISTITTHDSAKSRKICSQFQFYTSAIINNEVSSQTNINSSSNHKSPVTFSDVNNFPENSKRNGNQINFPKSSESMSTLNAQTKNIFDFSKLNVLNSKPGSGATTNITKTTYNFPNTLDIEAFSPKSVNKIDGLEERRKSPLTSIRLRKDSKTPIQTERRSQSNMARNKSDNFTAETARSKPYTPPEISNKLPAVQTSRRKVNSTISTKENFDIKNIIDAADGYKEDPVIKKKLDDIMQNIVDIRNVLNQKTKTRLKIASAPTNLEDPDVSSILNARYQVNSAKLSENLKLRGNFAKVASANSNTRRIVNSNGLQTKPNSDIKINFNIAKESKDKLPVKLMINNTNTRGFSKK